jgi:hypothetical protein
MPRLLKPRLRRASACGALVALGAMSISSCLPSGYPLAQGGAVDIRLEVAGALFAADTLDDAGNATGPRQQPFQTNVSLFLTEGGAPAFGAFVTVRVEPREALALRTADGDPTCGEVDGAFRCMASSQGLAGFAVTSEGAWSGDASLIVTWADQTKEKEIQILPAGLPQSATNFTMLIGGLDQTLENSRVLPTFLGLKCKVGPDDDDLGSKWRPGQIRAREAYVRATPPTNSPGVVENAPAIIESLSGEAALSLDASCSEASRRSRLRVVLGETGDSERFFLCFSDIGGEAEFAVTSGQKQIDPGPTILVDPEPRLLRVRTLQSVVDTGTEIDLFEVSAFDVNRVRLAIPIDLAIDDDQIVMLEQTSLTLEQEPDPVTLVRGTPKAVGQVHLHVTPRLLSSPECVSGPLSVIDTL